MILPPDFISRTQVLLGSEYPILETALQTESPVSIRINRRKGIGELPAERVPWSDTGYYLPERLPFTFDPLFHAGGYYVQEASSMFLEQAIRRYVHAPVKCLDLCAAPGGKSTHLASLLPEGSLLVSNEVIRSRSHILAENMMKWGSPDVIVTNNDPVEIGRLTHLFDVIVTDVPCSGEGMFRKDPESMKEWSVNNVNLCAARQRRIIHDIWEALKPGGLLIYSTCTYNTEENEENIQYIIEEMGAEALPIPLPQASEITGAFKYTNPVYRFLPHKTKGEGFFLAVLRKEEGEVYTYKNRNKNKKEKGKNSPAVPPIAYDWLITPEDYTIQIQQDTLSAIPTVHLEDYHRISAELKVVNAGIRLGEIKGKDLIPAQGLALSTALNRAACTIQEVDWPEAIKYLKKEPLLLPEGVEKGYVLVTYQQYPLGFVKHLGNRANNLYPQEWRIRSGYLPEERPSLLIP